MCMKYALYLCTMLLIVRLTLQISSSLKLVCIIVYDVL